jgi:hypothetical protein
VKSLKSGFDVAVLPLGMWRPEPVASERRYEETQVQLEKSLYLLR